MKKDKITLLTKPWGKEAWLELNENYCFKRIFFKAGNQCSLQYHENKKETIYVESGRGFLWISRILIDPPVDYSLAIDGRDICYGPDKWTRIYKIPIKSSDFFTIPSGVIHRIEALTDLTTLEVSTPEVDDCIRIQDDSNRPNGRIENEFD